MQLLLTAAVSLLQKFNVREGVLSTNWSLSAVAIIIQEY